MFLHIRKMNLQKNNLINFCFVMKSMGFEKYKKTPGYFVEMNHKTTSPGNQTTPFQKGNTISFICLVLIELL